MSVISPRACDSCTACCDGWVWMTINGVRVSAGHPCPHSTGHGCAIYVSRPVDPCVKFRCGWLLDNSPLPEWMRPDKAKVLVYFNKLTWRGMAVDVAVPVGRRIPKRALDWLMQFSRQHKRPLIYMEQIVEDGVFVDRQTMTGYGPPEFRQQLLEWNLSGRELL